MSDLPSPLSTLLQPVTRTPTSPLIAAWDDRPAGAADLVGLSPSPIIAQQFDQDILGDISDAWTNFIDSGQVWALIIGIVLGYMIRNLTAY
jgi:hypothetical protein